MNKAVEHFLALLRANDGINHKARLQEVIQKQCKLTRDRSVFYCDTFAVRFSASKTPQFSNTVLSLSNLRKYDNQPFFVCIVAPSRNYCLLANSTFLRKISHSSQLLRADNIRGSFNGSDIIREFEGIPNEPPHFDRLFQIHASVGFEGNLPRLVEATNSITPSGAKFFPNRRDRINILTAPRRALHFIDSEYFRVLKAELDAKVEQYKSYIVLAALIENVNVRGRVIEYLIAGESERLVREIVVALEAGNVGMPPFRTDTALGDYSRSFNGFNTQTDIKTKVMVLSSNPNPTFALWG